MGHYKSNSSTGFGSLFMGRHDKEYRGKNGTGYGSTRSAAKRDHDRKGNRR